MKGFLFVGVLVAILSGKVLVALHIVVDFKINQQEIIRLSCENKNRPEMRCNGTCYLAKKMQKAFQAEQSLSKENQRSLVDLKLVLDKDLMLRICTPTIQSFDTLKETKRLTHTYSSPPPIFLTGVFHPPEGKACSLNL